MRVTAGSVGGIVITDGQIAQFKATLRLTAAQERYWAPVEAALRDMSQRQAQQSATRGFVQRLKAVTLDAAGLRRLTSAAMPLLKSLDERPETERHACGARDGFYQRRIGLLISTDIVPERAGRLRAARCVWACGSIPKFANTRGTFSCELRNQRATSNFMILVPLLNPKFAIGLAALACELRVRGTSVTAA